MERRRRRTTATTARLLATVLATIAAVTTPAFSQGHHVRFDRLSLDEGLSQVTATAIRQDRTGYVWIGTQDGLNRFDGYEVTVFKPDPNDPHSLADNHVVGLWEDRDGAFWLVGTQIGRLSRFDPVRALTRRFLNDPDDPVGLAQVFLLPRFYQDEDGHVWIAAPTVGVEKVDPESGGVTHLVFDPAVPDGLPGATVTDFYEDRSGTLWVATNDGGLARRLPPEGGRERFAKVVDEQVTTVHEDRAGELWIGTAAHGLFRVDRDSGRLDRPPQPSPARSGAPSNVVAAPPGPDLRSIVEDRAGRLWVMTAGGLLRLDADRRGFRFFASGAELPTQPLTILYQDHSGGLWAGTNGGGLWRYDPERDAFTGYVRDPADPESLAANSIQSIAEDRSGVLWIGTTQGGVSRYSPLKHQFRTYSRPPRAVPPFQDNMVYAVLVDHGGTLWTGTFESGLYRLDASRGEVVERYALLPGDPRDIGSDWVRALHEDAAGHLWVGTVGGGLSEVDPAAGRVVRRFVTDSEDPGTLSSNLVNDVLEDHEGILWIGTNVGWNRLDPASGKVRRFLNDPSDPSSLGANFVRVSYEDRRGDLWVSGVGLSRFDRGSGTFVNYAHDPSDPSSLGNNLIFDLHDDGRGHLWIATYGRGLDRLDLETGVFDHFTSADGLSSDSLYCLLGDASGNLWTSTTRGLTRFDPRDGATARFDKDDGLPSNEFNGRSCFRSPRGELFFGGVGGVTAFRPEEVESNPRPPPVVLTAFRKFGETVLTGPELAGRERLVLSHKDSFFAFEFAALDYHHPAKNRYAYKLEGFDHDWIESGDRRYASYTNLDGGSYTFRVRGSNGDGVWSDEEAAIGVVVVPPPWRTWWAYLLYVMVATAGVFGYVRVKTAEAENRRRHRELDQARSIQLSMLPEAPPEVPGLEIAAYMKTATEVGGDYYDFLPAADGSLYVVTGDATGHGIPAGMMVSMTKSALRALEVGSPEVLLGQLGRVFAEVRLERMKMALNVVRIDGGEVTLSSAAMPPVYHYRHADGRVEEVLVPGLPLGSQRDGGYRLARFHFEPGDLLLLLSDGLPELSDGAGHPLGYEAVKRCLEAHGERPATEVLEALVELGLRHAAAAPLTDDVTLVAVRRT